MCGVSWALLVGQGRDPRQREIGRLLIEAGEEGPEMSCGDEEGCVWCGGGEGGGVEEDKKKKGGERGSRQRIGSNLMPVQSPGETGRGEGR